MMARWILAEKYPWPGSQCHNADAALQRPAPRDQEIRSILVVVIEFINKGLALLSSGTRIVNESITEVGWGENNITHSAMTAEQIIMQLEDVTSITASNRDCSAGIGRARTVALFATHELGLLLKGGAADTHLAKGGMLLRVFSSPATPRRQQLGQGP